MPFTLEPDVLLKTKNGVGLSDRTKKDYTAKLNMLTRAGLADDRASLKKNSKKIIAHIESLYPGDDEKARFKKRFIIYSIFWAMDETYLTKTNAFHKYLNTIPPITNSVTKKGWVNLDTFREEQKESDSD